MIDLENDYERFFPLYYLDLATSLFKFGESFDIASIFHSSSALALGLLIKLNTKLTNEEKGLVDYWNFKRIIEKSKDRGLLGDEHCELADNIRLIRNCYVHFESTMAYFNRLFEYYRDRESILVKYETKEELRIVDIILNSHPIQPLSIPDMTWCAYIDTVRFLEERHATFGRELIRVMAESYGKRIDTKRAKRVRMIKACFSLLPMHHTV